MSSVNDEQPTPIKTNNRATWEIVMGYAKGVFPLEDPLAVQIIDDMRERHEIGVKRYGEPLTANNGRCALTDAYQEHLDGCVYLAQWLSEQGVDVEELVEAITHSTLDLSSVPEHVGPILNLFIDDMAKLPVLRDAINMRPS